MKRLQIILPIAIFSFNASAQSVLKDSVMNLFMINVNYTYQMPFGELKERFGNNSALGLGIGGKVGKNVLLRLEGDFLFGRNVKENDMLDEITDANGFLIGTSGLYADFTYSEKGYSLQFQSGRIFSFEKPNVNSGITALFGAGFMQHKISIDADENEVPMLSKQYKKGYDRLTNGFMLTQFIGYYFFDSKRKMINFYGGIELQEAFTKNRRAWNFDENRKDDANRLDFLLGIKLGWILPFYRAQTEKFYYN